MKKEFKCHKNCGQCCDSQTSMVDGREFGMYLTLDEIKLFPEETVFPLFRRGGEVFAYQMGQYRCPNLLDDGESKTCKIYESRPLICRAFPASCSDDDSLFVQIDKCPSATDDPEQSFDTCFRAVKEQIEQAKNAPRATEIFILNGKKWVTL